MRNYLRCWISLYFGIMLLGVIFIPTLSAHADAPAPTYMAFRFIFHVENISIVGGKLLNCDDENCNKYTQFENSLYCLEKNSCMAYSSDPNDNTLRSTKYHKIIVNFTDKTRESNVFTFQGGGEQYNVEVENDYLNVREDNSLLSHPLVLFCFTAAEFFTVSIELIVAAIYTKIIKVKKSFLLLVVLANILSLPIVWFIFRPIFSDDIIFWSVAESFVVIFEAAFMFLFGRRYEITLKQVSILSLLMNTASFLMGLIIVYWFIHLYK
jgi:hypothetical protein